MATVAIDWDDTLVGYKKHPAGEWLPGAQEALYQLLRRHDVVIHSCRANWDEGYDEIVAALAVAGFALSRRLSIHASTGKPLAFAYVDDHGVAFDGDWPAALAAVERHAPPTEKPSSRPIAGTTVLTPINPKPPGRPASIVAYPKWKRFG